MANCKICGKRFSGKDPRKQTCGVECGYKLVSIKLSATGEYKLPLRESCIICGNVVRKQRHTCSPECGRRYKTVLRAKWGTLDERLDAVRNGRSCPVCKTIFWTLNYKVKTCGNAACARSMIGAGQLSGRDRRWNAAVPKPCANPMCTVMIEVSKFHDLAAFRRTNYCSIHCSKAFGAWAS